jgi:hypothetical protein
VTSVIDSEQLLGGLARGTLPAAEFSHYNHVRAAWLVLQQLPLRVAAHHFAELLATYVRQVGAEDKFHLTLTFAFMHLIHQRMKTSPEDWEGFVQANPDLFTDAKSLVARYYSAGKLMTPEARKAFVEPDRAPLP